MALGTLLVDVIEDGDENQHTVSELQSVYEVIARANNTTSDDVAELTSTGSYTGEHYLVVISSGEYTTYYHPDGITDTLTDYGTDSNGIRTLTGASGTYTVVNKAAIIGGDTVKYSLLGSPTESQIETVMSIFPHFIFDETVAFDTGNIQMPEGTKITVANGATVSSTSTTSGDCIFFLGSNTTIECEETGYLETESGIWAIRTPSDALVKNILLSNVKVSGYGGFAIIQGYSSSGTDYTDYTTDDLVKNVTILNPICNDSTLASYGSASAKITLQYCDGVTIRGGHVVGYFGIQYWGGDSSPSEDGAYDNERLARNILIDGVNLDECYLSPCWGSMGHNVVVTNCHAIRSEIGGDVGFDHEGTYGCVTSNCVVENYQNGAGACFYYTRDSKWSNCVFTAPAGYPCFKSYNSTQNGVYAGDRIFTNCNFVCSDTSGSDYAYINVSGTARNWSIDRSNVCRNVRISIGANNQEGAIYCAPIMEFTYAATTAYNLCTVQSVGYGTIIISPMFKFDDITMEDDTYAVKAYSTSYGGYPRFYIEDIKSNKNLPILIDEGGTNSGLNAYFWVTDCVCSAIDTTVSGAGTASVNVEHDNYSMYGTEITSASID